MASTFQRPYWQIGKRLALLLIPAFFGSSAMANTGAERCIAIVDDNARLSCYDSAFALQAADAQAELLSEPVTTDAESAEEAIPSPLESRRIRELALADEWDAITPHKQNYLLPATYNDSADYSNYGLFGDTFSDTEVKFQLSLKTLLKSGFWYDSSIWVGYTQQSYWQLYAEEEASSPFRETNHEPEVFWEFPVDFSVLGWNARAATVGFNHQSNGRSEPLSRSWNRFTGELALDKGNFVLTAKSWLRFEEDEEDDDNPKIEDYMGRLQLGLTYRKNRHEFALALKNNLRESDNRSGVEFNWTFPFFSSSHIRGFLQVYSGYGENLIDMENYNNRIGLGIAITEYPWESR